MNLAQLLEKLDGAKKQGGGYMAKCPTHDDRKASLSISHGDQGVVLYCHAGCETRQIVAAIGLEMSDLFDEPLAKTNGHKRQIVATYDYRDEDRTLLFQSLRYEPKGFEQRKPDGQGGWLWSLNGARRVLYRLPELLTTDLRATVFLCEGEKDVDRLRSLGLVATTNPMGAGVARNNFNWRDEYNECLCGREVVIIPDNDKPGRDHAEAVARSLNGTAASVKILALPNLPDKGDVSDWLDAGGEVETLCSMVDDLPEWTQANKAQPEGAEKKSPLAVSWADFDAEQFVQGERIAFAVERGEIALVNALPNAGKTTLALNVAVSLAAGRIFPPVVIESRERRVLYIDGETRRARLQRDLRTMTRGLNREEAIAVGQNLNVICEAEISGESLALTRTDHLLAISAEALRVKPDFIVVDTLSSLCPVFNENDNAEQTRKVWRPLQKIARDCDAAILVLHHVGKRSEDSQTPERVYRGRGASASGGAARAVWLLIPDPVTPGLSTLSCVKAKGESPADVRLQLDPSTRWIRQLEAVAPAPMPLEIVVAAITEEMPTAEIVAALKDRFSEKSVKNYLAEAVEQGLIEKLQRGRYAPKSQSATCAESAKGELAQIAQVAQTENNLRANRAIVIGDAQIARTRKPNKTNEFDVCANRATPIDDCTICTNAASDDFERISAAIDQ